MNSMQFTALAKFLAFLVAARPVVARGYHPGLQWDPETELPCITWYDNAEGESCEQVRDYWNITPEEFTKWNPSVGLDCKPWRYQSYCVVPQIRFPDISSSETSTVEPTTTVALSTSVAPTLQPSPTSWEARGCYIDEDPEEPVLEKRISQDGGDDNLTIADCQETCYQEAFIFAGVKTGNECWCSTYISGGKTNNATAECNSPCTGDEEVNCGGKDRVDVFAPLIPADYYDRKPQQSQTTGDGSAEQESDVAEAEPSPSSIASEDSVVQEDDAESGASMNGVMFMRGFLG